MKKKTPLPSSPDKYGRIDPIHPTVKQTLDTSQTFYQIGPDEAEMSFLNQHLQGQTLQYAIHANVRFLKVNYTKVVCGVTAHFLILFHSDSKGGYELIGIFHVLTIKKLYFGTSFKGVVFFSIRLTSYTEGYEKIKPRIIIDSPRVLDFSRIVFRNFNLAYSTAYGIPGTIPPEELRLEIETDHPEYFPTFQAKLSPSQQFQFTYSAICSLEGVKYNHEVVRYFHRQVVNHNGVFNVGLLPLEFLSSIDGRKSELMPIFRSLIYVPYMFGVVCQDVSCPDIMSAISLQLCLSHSLHFVHVNNCNAVKGLEDFSLALESNLLSPIEYIDVSGNKFNDFPSLFTTGFQNLRKPLWYLGLNQCGLTGRLVSDLFTSLEASPQTHRLKYLHIAGADIVRGIPEKFAGFLSKIEAERCQCLKSIDLRNIVYDISPMLQILQRHKMPLEILKVGYSLITNFGELINLVEQSELLHTLDVSGTNAKPETIARIIVAMSSKPSLRQLTLHLNHLNIHGIALIAVVKGFLNGNMDRWRELSFDANNMDKADFQLLVALLARMPNLVTLSMSSNFSEKMRGIELELPDLLRIPRLQKLKLVGDSKKRLGKAIIPMLFCIGASYVLRRIIGMNEMDQKKHAVEEESMALFLEFGIGEEDANEMKKRVGEMLIPYIRAKKLAEFNNKDVVLDELKPLAEAVFKANPRIQYDTKSDSFGQQVMPYLQDVSGLRSVAKSSAKNCALEILEIGSNRIGSCGIECVCELLKLDRELKGIIVDGSSPSTLSDIAKLAKVIVEGDHLSEMRFPKNDAARFVSKTRGAVRKAVEKDLHRQQALITESVNRRRIKEGNFSDLPFELVDELKAIIRDHTSRVSDYLVSDSVFDHSGICEDFNMTLPYLELDSAGIIMPDDYKTVDIGEQVKYHAPGMKKRYIEQDPLYTIPDTKIEQESVGDTPSAVLSMSDEENEPRQFHFEEEEDIVLPPIQFSSSDGEEDEEEEDTILFDQIRPDPLRHKFLASQGIPDGSSYRIDVEDLPPPDF